MISTSAEGLPIQLCDYLFPGDVAQDAVDSINELFSLKATEDDVEMNVETCPGKRW